VSREAKPTDASRSKSGAELKIVGEAALVNVTGLVDEHFGGFGTIGPMTKAIVIDVSGMTRMTSFGVRQWLKAMDALPKSVGDLYLLGCPTFFVDQLNMVLNFGGQGRVLTVVAPYTCPSCGNESGETVDVLAERATLAKGAAPEKECRRCQAKLEFDETPESYFSFVTKYAASNIHPAAAQLLQSMGLYNSTEAASDKPPRIIKIVHGQVTYFRLIGTVGSMFKARPFLVGAEGEIVLDLGEVSRFDPAGIREWKRLLKTMAGQVPSVTLVDVTDSFLMHAADSLSLARNIAAASVLVPYYCLDCGKVTATSHGLENAAWPLDMPEQVCAVCGGTTRSALQQEALIPLQKASTSIPSASSKVIANRKELLSRAIADASVASAGESASAALGADDTILGKYQIVRRLSQGGMAEVFLAKQVGIGGFEKPVALKRILRQLLESRHLAVDMFLNEAKIAGRLMHPNIVQVLDVGEEKGALFLAMEYVRGKDLRDLLKKLRAGGQNLPLGDACFVIKEVALALHHAYWSADMNGKQHSVVHRDVSPHNVMIGFDGAVKLLDFGVAMSSVTEHEQSMIAGKWAYMSPEHTTNQPVDHRSDLFSLGVMAYLLFTGKMPFAGSDPREIVKKIRAGDYKPVRDVAPNIPPEIASLVSRMLASRAADRPQTGQEIATELSQIARANGFESNQTSMANLIVTTFSGESAEIPRDVLRLAADESNRKLATGSGPTLADSDSPSMRSSSQSMNRMTPTGMSNQMVDVSVSLQPRNRPTFTTPTSNRAVTAPDISDVKLSPDPIQATKPAAVGNKLTLALIIVLLLGAAVVMYLLVKPT
jgi:serine/threonine protein kinase/anti-anti-sigma regulatory factor